MGVIALFLHVPTFVSPFTLDADAAICKISQFAFKPAVSRSKKTIRSEIPSKSIFIDNCGNFWVSTTLTVIVSTLFSPERLSANPCDSRTYLLHVAPLSVAAEIVFSLIIAFFFNSGCFAILALMLCDLVVRSMCLVRCTPRLNSNFFRTF